jgi:WD40 repeat protein
MKEPEHSAKLLQVFACGEDKAIVSDSSQIRFVDITKGVTLSRILCAPRCVAWNPVKRQLAVACKTDITLWNLDTGELVAKMPRGPKKTNWTSIDISPDGNTIVACNETFRIWTWYLDRDHVFEDAMYDSDDDKRKLLRNLKQVRFSRAGDKMAAIGRDQGLGTIRVGKALLSSPWLNPWGTIDFSHIRGQLKIAGFAYGRRWLAYQGTYYTGGDRHFPLEDRYKTYFLMAAHDRDPLDFIVFDEHPVHITALDVDGDDRWIAAAGKDRWLRMSRFPTKEENQRNHPYDLEGPAVEVGFDVVSVSFSPDGKQLAVGGAGGALQLWSIPDVGGNAKSRSLPKIAESNCSLIPNRDAQT